MMTAMLLQAQNPVFSIRDINFPFAFRESYFVLTPDTLYRSSDGILWDAEKNTFEFRQMQLSYVEDNSIGFIFHESGGKIVSFNGIRFSVYHQSPEYRNQYKGLPFIHNKNPHIFGGVGLFTYKNIITGYDRLQMEWVKIRPKTPINELPQQRYGLCGGAEGGELFVGPGFGIDKERSNSETYQIQLNDFWRFNFATREWSMMGNLIADIDLRRYLIINNYKGGALLIGLSDAYYFDIKGNRLVRYGSVDVSMLAETAGNIPIPTSIAYNKNTDKFIVLVAKEDGYRMPLVVNSERLLGRDMKESRLYKRPFPYLTMFFASMLFLAAAVLIYFRFIKIRKVKSLYEKVVETLPAIEEILTNEEFSILKMIIQKNPEPVQFLDLMSIFDPKMSYESHKKRLRSSLLSIEEKLKKHLHTNADVFDISRSKEDRRNKEIKFS
ncbi:MAG: hypothetical protein BGO30_02640 [Bacteroidetes bacterium 41-46]|nr:MAG: hypothetical protein BGO30_02640 [Bacteroidetes bacterium 41-46]